jgi:hypothetical protein
MAKDERTRERLIEQTKNIENEYQSVCSNHTKAKTLFEEANRDFTKETTRFEKREAQIRVNRII